jgi:hypothetical protein
VYYFPLEEVLAEAVAAEPGIGCTRLVSYTIVDLITTFQPIPPSQPITHLSQTQRWKKLQDKLQEAISSGPYLSWRFLPERWSVLTSLRVSSLLPTGACFVPIVGYADGYQVSSSASRLSLLLISHHHV